MKFLNDKVLCNVEAPIVDGVDIAKGFRIYPVPASEKLTIDAKNRSGRITLQNINGTVVYESAIKERKHEVDLNKIPAGMYIITIEDGDNYYSSKIAIE